MIVSLIALACSPEPPARPEAPTPVVEQEDPGAILAAGKASLDAAGIDEIRWAVSPWMSGQELSVMYRELLAYVSERVGVPVVTAVPETYAEIESFMVNGQIDAAAMTPYAYVRARAQVPGIEVIASHVAEGSVTYGSYLVARMDSGIRDIRNLKGHSFGFVDRRSTSGWLYPAHLMLDNGIHPFEDLDARFLGSHDAVFDAVAAGEVDAGAVYSGALGAGRERNPRAGAIRVVAKTRRIPYDAYVVRDGFPEPARKALAQALSEVSTLTPQGRDILSNTPWINGFMPVDDSHYDGIRRVEAIVTGELGAEPLGTSTP